MRWTKIALATRVDALASRHSGRELVDAIVAFADTLVEDDRELLRQVLLARSDEAVVSEYAVRRRGKSPRRGLFRRGPRERDR
jgi:hypothetical protein